MKFARRKWGNTSIFGLWLAAAMLSSCTLASPGIATATSAAVQTPANTQAAAPTGTTSPTGTPPPGVNPSVEPTLAPAVQPSETQTAIRTLEWKELVRGLQKPTALVEVPDGSGLLAVVEQMGVIRLMQKDGSLLAQPYLDLRDRVGSSNVEQGLLGLAFHPKYADNGYFFVNYTDRAGNTVIARFQRGSNPTQGDPANEKILIQVGQPYPNHNGGCVVFGPDGYLYLSLGDGGSGGDPQNHAQSTHTLLGKILRIDVDHGDPYAIPADNPFVKGGGLAEIWAYGLRNPWRFSFDAVTGDLYIADVGQDRYEEVDFVPAGSPGGLNFGWNFREGLHPYKGNPPAGVKFVDPVWEYSHDYGCSITGGFVYHGQSIPQLQGAYLYADYCSGRVWSLQHDSAGNWQNQQLFETGAAISSFGVDLQGELYLLDHSQGRVMRLEYQ